MLFVPTDNTIEALSAVWEHLGPAPALAPKFAIPFSL